MASSSLSGSEALSSEAVGSEAAGAEVAGSSTSMAAANPAASLSSGVVSPRHSTSNFNSEPDLMAMKVAELKEELEARGEGKTGNKAWLRRRLHAAIVHEYLKATVADEEGGA